MQSGLDLVPILVGPGRGRGRGRGRAVAHRPGPIQEKLANSTESAPGGLELAVMVHLKVRAGMFQGSSSLKKIGEATAAP